MLDYSAGAGEVVSGFGGITTMQAMTSSVCSKVTQGTEGRLRDTRDNKIYWVTKLKDNNCWMTQNLDLDLSTQETLTAANTDISNDWTPTNNTQTGDQPSSFYSATNYNILQSWDPAGGGAEKYCTDGLCITTSTVGNKHYAQGNYYTWAAATAGQSVTFTSSTDGEESTQSICPKGWRLPLGGKNNTVSKTFYYLLDQYGLTSQPVNDSTGFNITAAPLYFVYSDRAENNFFYPSASMKYGYYWTSTAGSALSAYNLRFYILSSGAKVFPYDTAIRYDGLSVRCVAR